MVGGGGGGGGGGVGMTQVRSFMSLWKDPPTSPQRWAKLPNDGKKKGKI